MPLFELDESGARIVQPMAPAASTFEPDASVLVGEHLGALLGESLFPVATRRGDSTDVPHLLALDVVGQPVVVEVVQVLDADALVRALRYAGVAGSLTSRDLAAAYQAGPDRFRDDLVAFRESLPVAYSRRGLRVGSRLLLVCAEVSEEVVDAVDYLRAPDRQVEVLQIGVVRGDDGRRYIDVSPLLGPVLDPRPVESQSARIERSREAFAAAMAYDAQRAPARRIPSTPSSPSPASAPTTSSPGKALTPVTPPGVPAVASPVHPVATNSTPPGPPAPGAPLWHPTFAPGVRPPADLFSSPAVSSRGETRPTTATPPRGLPVSPSPGPTQAPTSGPAQVPPGPAYVAPTFPAQAPSVFAPLAPAVVPASPPTPAPASPPTLAPAPAQGQPRAPSSADPKLVALAAQRGPAELVWFRERRRQRLTARLRPDGTIELPTGAVFTDPDTAAREAARSAMAVDGWQVWCLGDGGPSLRQAVAP